MAGSFGLGADQILGARLVSPSGEIFDADDEILWGLQGGGCNFGVITSLKIKVYPLPEILAGMIVFPVSEAKKVLLGYQNLLDGNFPDVYEGDMVLVNLPGAGKVLVFLFTWESSDFEAGVKFADKIRDLGPVAMDTVAESTSILHYLLVFIDFKILATHAAWVDFGKAFAPPGVYMSVRSAYLPLRLTEPLIDVVLKYVENVSSSPYSKSAILLHSCHGLGAKPNPNSCFQKREPHIMIEIIGASISKEEKDNDYL